MKIHFSKYNWTNQCYKPRIGKYFSGKMIIFTIYKFGITFDFRKNFQITDLLTSSEKLLFWKKIQSRRMNKNEYLSNQ